MSLHKCESQGVNLEHECKMSNSEIITEEVKQELKNVRFSTKDLCGKEFYNCTLSNCIFSDIDMSDSKFYDTIFINCNFSNSRYSATQFRDTSFRGCKLIGAGFSDKNFAFSANFTECDLRYAEFSGLNLSKKHFHQCNLDAARFMRCNLKETKFTESSFKGTIFHNCNLQHATFIEAKYLFIDPMQNKVKDTSVDILTAGNIVNHFGFNIVC